MSNHSNLEDYIQAAVSLTLGIKACNYLITNYPDTINYIKGTTPAPDPIDQMEQLLQNETGAPEQFLGAAERYLSDNLKSSDPLNCDITGGGQYTTLTATTAERLAEDPFKVEPIIKLQSTTQLNDEDVIGLEATISLRGNDALMLLYPNGELAEISHSDGGYTAVNLPQGVSEKQVSIEAAYQLLRALRTVEEDRCS